MENIERFTSLLNSDEKMITTPDSRMKFSDDDDSVIMFGDSGDGGD